MNAGIISEDLREKDYGFQFIGYDYRISTINSSDTQIIMIL